MSDDRFEPENLANLHRATFRLSPDRRRCFLLVEYSHIAGDRRRQVVTLVVEPGSLAVLYEDAGNLLNAISLE